MQFAGQQRRAVVMVKLEQDVAPYHYTPRHGSWLNMVEIELSVFSRQCLARRIPSRDVLENEARAWQIDELLGHHISQLIHRKCAERLRGAIALFV